MLVFERVVGVIVLVVCVLLVATVDVSDDLGVELVLGDVSK